MEFGEIFRSKLEYSQDFFVLLSCLGKRAVLEWFMKEGMLASKRVCPVCGCDMKLQEKQRRIDGFVWLCKKQDKVGVHEICQRIRGGSWFEESHMNLCDIMKLISVWFGKCKQKYARRECDVMPKISIDCYSFNREDCMVHNLSVDFCEKLGDSGKIVETDKSVFGKMKYGRKRPVNGKWVFGGVERGSNK